MRSFVDFNEYYETLSAQFFALSFGRCMFLLLVGKGPRESRKIYEYRDFPLNFDRIPDL